MGLFTPFVFIRAYPRNPRFFFVIPQMDIPEGMNNPVEARFVLHAFHMANYSHQRALMN
jgi:hypothetical protein